MKALILGGRGYLGSLISEINRHEGYFSDIDIIDVVKDENGASQDIMSIKNDHIHALVHGVDEIFILASPVGKDQLHDESKMFDLNFRSISKIIQASSKKTVINFFSSGATFEGYDEINATPTTLPVPITSYSKYKWLMENFIFRYAKRHRIFRLASCYGWSPNFKAHTLINSVLDTYNTKTTVKIKINRLTNISVTDASYAMNSILSMVSKHNFIGQTLHICQQFLSVQDLVDCIATQFSVGVEFLDKNEKMGGYSIYNGETRIDKMKEEVKRSAAIFKYKADANLLQKITLK